MGPHLQCSMAQPNIGYEWTHSSVFVLLRKSPHQGARGDSSSQISPPLRRARHGHGFFLLPDMNSRRDFRSHRAAFFDGIEEGGIRAPAYSSQEIHEHENDQAMDSLHDRVSILKRLTGDIHEEVENHNRTLGRMGDDMDTSRGFLSGTVNKFKMVFETKSSRRMGSMVASFIAVFLLIYYLTK